MSDHTSPTTPDIPSDHFVYTELIFLSDRANQTGRTIPSDHPDCTDGLVRHFDQFMNFDHLNFSKARILKLSDDLASIWSR